MNITSADSSNPFSFMSLGQSVTINGRSFASSYLTATRTKIKTTLPDGSTIAYQHDSNDNLSQLTLPSGALHTYSYSTEDEPIRYNPPVVTGAPNPATNYQYNLAKQLTTVTRPDGQTLSFSYDPSGRLASLNLPNSQTVRYGYDAGTTCPTGSATTCTARPASGQLVSLTNTDATLAYTYDGPLRTSESWTGVVQGNVTNTWDNEFRVAARKVNGLQAIAYGYDADGLLTQAGGLTLTQSSAGQLSATSLGAITTQQSYDSYGSLVSFSDSNSNGNLYRKGGSYGLFAVLIFRARQKFHSLS